MRDITEIANDLTAQDNRCTDQPIFIVQQKKRIYGLDPNYCEDIKQVEWRTEDFEYAADEAESAEMEEAFQETGDVKDGWMRVVFMDIWEFVTACFTEQGCKDYIAANGHNLKEPRIYAEGSFRNEEWQTVRKFLLSQQKE